MGFTHVFKVTTSMTVFSLSPKDYYPASDVALLDMPLLGWDSVMKMASGLADAAMLFKRVSLFRMDDR